MSTRCQTGPNEKELQANPDIALWLQFTRPAGRVAELGELI